MTPNAQITIPTASLSSTSKPYTIYDISIRQPLRNVTLPKRYSDFTSLHEGLTTQAGQAPPAPLPQKNWFKSTVGNATLTEERRQGLEAYLKAVNNSSDSRWRDTSAWRIFLNLSSSSSGGDKVSRAAASAGPLSELRAPVTDPTAWLDVHKDLKSQLRDVKLSLAKRDQARAAQEEHEASADAKRCLVRAATMISALEGGLQNMAQRGSQQAIGDGELRRRRDLISSAKKDREGLEEQLNARATRDSRTGTDATSIPSNVKDELLGDGGARTSASRRKLGGQAKETERTRELDNTGVLQLQKQIMEEQDVDVSALTSNVQRLRAMGIQINDELEAQNDMLDVIDRDVERVDNKVNVARRRIGKIK